MAENRGIYFALTLTRDSVTVKFQIVQLNINTISCIFCCIALNLEYTIIYFADVFIFVMFFSANRIEDKKSPMVSIAFDSPVPTPSERLSQRRKVWSVANGGVGLPVSTAPHAC